MQPMLVGVKFDTCGADRQQAFLILAEVGDELIGMICAFLLVILECPNMVVAVLGGTVATWNIPVSTHYIMNEER